MLRYYVYYALFLDTGRPVWRQPADHHVHAARIRCTFADGAIALRVLFPFKELLGPPRDPARLETVDRVFITVVLH